MTFAVNPFLFCSVLYSKTKDLGDTAMRAGNSAEMVRTHYTS